MHRSGVKPPKTKASRITNLCSIKAQQRQVKHSKLTVRKAGLPPLLLSSHRPMNFIKSESGGRPAFPTPRLVQLGSKDWV